LSVAKQRSQLITAGVALSCCIATLYKALVSFTEYTTKQTKNEALLHNATLKCERTLNTELC